MQPLLSNGPIEAEQVDELAELRAELAELREDFNEFRVQVQRDRDGIGAFLHGLRALVNGGAPSSSVAGGGVPTPHNDAAWQMWKSRLPGACPKVIDALLIQPLTATQLITATKTSHSTVQRALDVLKNNSLIEKNGDRISLKRL